MAGYIVPFFIGGKEFVPGKTFDVVSPATGKTVHKCGSASIKDATAAADSAAEALKTWRKTKPSQRRDIMLKAAEIMERRSEELIGYMIEETGSQKEFAGLNVTIAVDTIKDVAGRVSSIQGTIPAVGGEGSSAMVVKEPYGAVLSIAPWFVPSRVLSG